MHGQVAMGQEESRKSINNSQHAVADLNCCFETLKNIILF